LSAVLPGLGQAYNGENDKAVSALAVSFGLLVTAAVVHVVARVSLRDEVDTVLPIYALIWLPAVFDAWRVASGQCTRLLAGESKAYVLLMLSIAGPLAFPLLWQSPRFARSSKIVWTSVVVLSLVVVVRGWITVGPAVDQLMRDLDEIRLQP
jgi:hypothetical protein